MSQLFYRERVEFARSARQRLAQAGLSVEYLESDAAHHIDAEALRRATEWLGETLPTARP
jgi:phospholipase/carboxylesterase